MTRRRIFAHIKRGAFERLADSIRTFGGLRTRAAWLNGDASPAEWARGRPVVTDDLSELMIASLRRNRR